MTCRSVWDAAWRHHHPRLAGERQHVPTRGASHVTAASPVPHTRVTRVNHVTSVTGVTDVDLRMTYLGHFGL